jgi:hypothetical protein
VEGTKEKSGAGALLASNVMMKTSYGGASLAVSGTASYNKPVILHTQAISKALANQKIRKLRQAQAAAENGHQNPRNNSTGHGYLINGGGEHSFS